jgi:hypothetical protein
MEATCIYCGKSEDLCEAHIVPESLGKFKNLPKQKKLICSKCDHEIGKAEEQLAKSGVEAIFRANLDIKGKKKHKPSSPFRRRHAGQGPIELKTKFPDTDYEVLVEPLGDGKNVQPLPQLVLSDSKGNYDLIRLSNPKEVTGEYLKNAVDKLSLEKGQLRVETVGMTNDEIDYIFNLLKDIVRFINEEPPSSPKKRYYPKVAVHGPVTVDTRYFRSIAKIGFHYFLQYTKCFSGREDCFAPLKQFIRHGKGKIEQFILQQRGNLVSDLNYGLRPKYYGHFIIGDFRKNTATAYVQFFIGRDSNPPYYKITLATNCFHIKLEDEIFGHFFSYYPPDNRSKHTGEIQRLGFSNKIHLPNVFGVDYLGR